MQGVIEGIQTSFLFAPWARMSQLLRWYLQTSKPTPNENNGQWTRSLDEVLPLSESLGAIVRMDVKQCAEGTL